MMQFIQHFRGLATNRTSFAISASKHGGQLVNEFFRRHHPKSRIFERMVLSSLDQKSFQELVFISRLSHLRSRHSLFKKRDL